MKNLFLALGKASSLFILLSFNLRAETFESFPIQKINPKDLNGRILIISSERPEKEKDELYFEKERSSFIVRRTTDAKGSLRTDSIFFKKDEAPVLVDYHILTGRPTLINVEKNSQRVEVRDTQLSEDGKYIILDMTGEEDPTAPLTKERDGAETVLEHRKKAMKRGVVEESTREGKPSQTRSAILSIRIPVGKSFNEAAQLLYRSLGINISILIKDKNEKDLVAGVQTTLISPRQDPSKLFVAEPVVIRPLPSEEESH